MFKEEKSYGYGFSSCCYYFKQNCFYPFQNAEDNTRIYQSVIDVIVCHFIFLI